MSKGAVRQQAATVEAAGGRLDREAPESCFWSSGFVRAYWPSRADEGWLRQRIAEYAFILPALILLVVILIYPMFTALQLSVSDVRLVSPTQAFMGFSARFTVRKITSRCFRIPTSGCDVPHGDFQRSDDRRISCPRNGACPLARRGYQGQIGCPSHHVDALGRRTSRRRSDLEMDIRYPLRALNDLIQRAFPDSTAGSLVG